MPSFLGYLSVDELSLLSFRAWNEGIGTTEDRARNTASRTAIQTYDEMEGEDPESICMGDGFTDFNSGTAHAETERLRQQLREVKARLAAQTQQLAGEQCAEAVHQVG